MNNEMKKLNSLGQNTSVKQSRRIYPATEKGCFQENESQTCYYFSTIEFWKPLKC